MTADILVLFFALLLLAGIILMTANLLMRPARAKTGGSEPEYDPYFIISGNAYLDYTSLSGLLANVGISPYPDTEDYIKDGHLLRVNKLVQFPRRVALSIVHTEEDIAGIDMNTYNIKSHVKSEHDKKSISQITNKYNLHHNVPDFVTKSRPLDGFEFKEGVYILRPAHFTACSGADIFVVSNEQEFAAAKQYYNEKIENYQHSKKEHIRNYKVLVSEYIRDPLLLDGKKFHIRLHGITVSGECKFKILRKAGQLMTAKLPYIQGDWLNKDIHDTHLRSTERDYFYPQDFPERSYLPRFEKFLDNLEIELSKHITCESYSESTHSYKLYGVDLMMREDGKPYLIEVNGRPGLARLGDKAARATSEAVCAWIWQNIQHFFAKS